MENNYFSLRDSKDTLSWKLAKRSALLRRDTNTVKTCHMQEITIYMLQWTFTDHTDVNVNNDAATHVLPVGHYTEYRLGYILSRTSSRQRVC